MASRDILQEFIGFQPQFL